MLVHTDSEGFVLDATREKSEQYQLCRGPWHNKGGKGTMLPASDFDVGRKSCRECLRKHRELNNPPEAAIHQLAADLQNGKEPPATPVGGAQTKWSVTIKEIVVRTTEMIVYAPTIEDAIREAPAGSNIVRVASLDD
jgi:hypothetical protein